MDEFKISVFIAIFEEMFGVVFFWFLVLMAIVGTVLFFYFLLAKKLNKSENFLWAKWVTPLAAVISVLYVFWFTSANLNDLGGTIDFIIVFMVAFFAALASLVLSYLAQSFSILLREAK